MYVCRPSKWRTIKNKPAKQYDQNDNLWRGICVSDFNLGGEVRLCGGKDVEMVCLQKVKITRTPCRTLLAGVQMGLPFCEGVSTSELPDNTSCLVPSPPTPPPLPPPPPPPLILLPLVVVLLFVKPACFPVFQCSRQIPKRSSKEPAPCGFQGCKNRPAPFPGRMS